MPQVGTKHFAYTAAGRRAAAKERKKKSVATTRALMAPMVAKQMRGAR